MVMGTIVDHVTRGTTTSIKKGKKPKKRGGGVSTLLDGLISWWSLDEASGVRADSHGSNNLTDNNNVLQTVGKIGNAADFPDKSALQYLQSTSAELIGGNVDYTIATWVYYNTGAFYALSKKGSYSIFYNSPLRFQISAGGLKTVDETNFPVLIDGTWYLAIVDHDASAKKIRISINNNTPDELTYTGTADPGTNQFRIGSSEFDFGSNAWEGRMDETGYWNRLLTSDERAELYNSGDGIGYPG